MASGIRSREDALALAGCDFLLLPDKVSLNNFLLTSPCVHRAPDILMDTFLFSPMNAQARAMCGSGALYAPWHSRGYDDMINTALLYRDVQGKI